MDAFSALAFGMPHPGTVDFLRNEHNNLMQRASNFVGDLGMRFIESAKNYYHNYVSDGALLRMRNIIHHLDTSNIEHRIVELKTLEEFQQAPLIMQNYVMADPVIRERFQKQLIDGYSDTYVDMEAGLIGLNHTDYRRVIDGTCELKYDEDGEIDTAEFTYCYLDAELPEGVERLEITEQTDIMSSWERARIILIEGLSDPTSPLGNPL